LRPREALFALAAFDDLSLAAKTRHLSLHEYSKRTLTGNIWSVELGGGKLVSY